MTVHIPNLTRRTFGWGMGACTFSFTLAAATGKIMASDLIQSKGSLLKENLQSALHTIGSDAAKNAANNLAQNAASSPRVNFHLGNAGFSADDVKLIANILDMTPARELARLHSFSLSDNIIGDERAKALAAALPKTLTELGLVGCAIGDQGGKAILEWAKYASGLRMICIEDNRLSQGLRT